MVHSLGYMLKPVIAIHRPKPMIAIRGLMTKPLHPATLQYACAVLTTENGE
jgi:hypothetical protein